MEEYAVKLTEESDYIAIGLFLKYIPTNSIRVSYKNELRVLLSYEERVKASGTLGAFPPIKN